MAVIARTTWRCPDCGWSASFDGSMQRVYCVECFNTGRDRDRVCERMVPASQLRGAVEDAKDADEASMQAAYWRARAIELGASEGEYRERYRERGQ